MALFLNDQLRGALPGARRISAREMWRRTLERETPERIAEARREAVEQCQGELLMFLELH